MPRMASRDPARSQTHASGKPMHADRLAGVLRAGRLEPAATPEHRRKQQLIRADRPERDLNRQPPQTLQRHDSSSVRWGSGDRDARALRVAGSCPEEPWEPRSESGRLGYLGTPERCCDESMSLERNRRSRSSRQASGAASPSAPLRTTITMSYPDTIWDSSVLIASRISRFARFRWTLLPNFFVAVIPNRVAGAGSPTALFAGATWAA